MRVEEFSDGIAICGAFPDKEVVTKISEYAGPLPLIIADPPYGLILPDYWDQVDNDVVGFVSWMTDCVNACAAISTPGSALYWWGGVGKPGFRPLYRFLAEVEQRTEYQISGHITWRKRRAYGTKTAYLWTREELIYMVLGDVKKPRLFNIPLLDIKRGYAGYSAKYPAKSEFLRRGLVWDDVTEIFRGKTHPAEKPVRLAEIPIEVHTVPGEFVLDPFAGSFSTAKAARKLDRRFVVVEKDLDIFEKSVASLR